MKIGNTKKPSNQEVLSQCQLNYLSNFLSSINALNI